MALPFIDDSTPLTAANLHGFVYGDGDTKVALAAWRINYDGAAWQVSSTFGSKSSAGDVGLTWDGTGNKLDIDLSSLTFGGSTFAGSPVAFVTPWAHTAHGTWNYDCQVRVTSTTDLYVRFADRDIADINVDTASYATAESTSMIFSLLVIGQIA